MKIIKNVLQLISFCFILIAKAQSTANEKSNLLKITLETNYSVENFNWSISGSPNGTNPNILSELTFRPLKSVGFQLNFNYSCNENIQLEAIAGMSNVFSGRILDIDYGSDNRTNPTSILKFRGDRGNSRIYKIGLKYRVVEIDQIVAIVGLGYGFLKSSYNLEDWMTSDIRAKYSSFWHGPQLKASPTWALSRKFNLGGDLNLNYLFFEGVGNWLLRSDFMHPTSFKQTSQGWGIDSDFFVKYIFSKCINLKFGGLYSTWNTHSGRDRLFLESGEIIDTKMNGAHRCFKSIFLGVLVYMK